MNAFVLFILSFGRGGMSGILYGSRRALLHISHVFSASLIFLLPAGIQNLVLSSHKLRFTPL
ncbi:unnamed protein product [Meloidogyne enterolobii]|uniref:Uncharacterized protein n=1 Tax=Meloidogyne enterolobii TaxID=390850 RepID=A0ACB0Z1A8_MELEN